MLATRRTSGLRIGCLATTASILTLAWGKASASESFDPEQWVRRARPVDEERVTAETRPFTFLVDPSTPSPGVLAIGYTVGLGSGVSADRPIPVVLQQSGVSNDFSLGYGVTRWFEPVATVNVNTNLTTSVSNVGGLIGAKFQLTSPGSPWRAAILAGALREGASASYGAWARASGSLDAGPVLIEANAYVESVFATGRDAADYIAMLGASYRVLPTLRVGAESVGQDIEEVGGSGAEGGARLGVGPDIALDLDHGRFQLVMAALFGLNAISPTAVVRLGLLGSF